MMSNTKMSRSIFLAAAVVVFAVAGFTGCKTSTDNAEELLWKGKAAYEANEYKNAIKYFTPAAEQGNLEAQYRLGLTLLYSEGVVAEKLSDLPGSASMEEVLRVIEEQEEERKKLESEGAEWLLKAAEQGYAPAQYSIGCCYIYGNRGVERDAARGIEWIRKAAEQDEPHSQNLLAECYAGGKNGVEKDMAEAVKWLRKAGENGLIIAQFKLGGYYLNGGVEVYEPEGLSLLGFPGVYNPDGKGIDKNVIDPAEGAKWFRKVAERAEADVQKNERNRYIEAQHNLGVLYSRGEGVEKDPVEAEKWYRKAAEQGYEKSKAVLKRLGAE